MISKAVNIIRLIVACQLLLHVFYTNGQNGSTPVCIETDSLACTNLHFPENWKSKTSRKITIPVKIYKTQNPIPSPPILWLSGGPGQSNMDYEPPSEFLENHDVILMGYRGIDGSVVLNCPEISRALKGRGDDLLSDESIDFVKQASGECASRLLNSGVDLDGYTIEQVLYDIDAVRSYFKIEKLNLLSASYGTRVAQLYAKFYSRHVNKSVMIGAGTPGSFIWEPAMINKKIEDYNLLCQADAYCKNKSEDLVKTFDEVIGQMPKRWFFIPIDPGKVKVVAFGMLYHKDTALQVIDAFLAAKEGDYSGIALMSLSYDYVIPDMMLWGDFLSKGMIDYDSTKNYGNEFKSTSYPLGSPLSTLFMDLGVVWPVAQPSSDFSDLNQSYIPSLVLNGALDFSTPHENVESKLMPLLKNGKLVVFKGAGHVADLLYRDEVIVGIKKFFLSGGVEFEDTTAIETFKIKNGFPKIAKIGLGVLVLASSLLIFLLYKAFRRLSRKLG